MDLIQIITTASKATMSPTHAIFHSPEESWDKKSEEPLPLWMQHLLVFIGTTPKKDQTNSIKVLEKLIWDMLYEKYPPGDFDILTLGIDWHVYFRGPRNEYEHEGLGAISGYYSP